MARRRPRRLRAFLWLTLGLALTVWLTPMLAARLLLPYLAARNGGSIEIEGARPALPFGVSAAHLVLRREKRVLELHDLRATWWRDGLRVDAKVGDGELLLRSVDLRASDGFLRVQSFALESLEPLLDSPLALHGRADGIYRFGAKGSVEGTVNDGSAMLRSASVFALPFAQLAISAARVPDGGWDVHSVNLEGPPLSGSAHGKIAANGALSLEAEVRQLEEPLRSLFPMLKLPTGPLPFGVSIGGTLRAPRVESHGAPAGANG
jgi:hypothetical protein